MTRIYAAAAGVSALVGATGASAETLNAADLNQLLSGKTIYLSAPFGSLPIRYSAGGSMVARSKAMGIFSGVSEDRGSWRIAGSRFCQRWQTWNGGKEQCFTVSRSGTSLTWISSDGMSGTAVAAK